MKKSITIILLIVSITGFIFSLHTRYLKNYVPGIEKADTKVSPKLNLSEAIAFVEKLEETKAASGVVAANYDNAVVLKKLKIIDTISLAGLIVTFILLLITRNQLRQLTKEKRFAKS